ncbi:uncharacterized protein LOC143430846 [Xylocopa sonorina]|uniref:uncharacterized protein LOC143430846 n=1 Tax=Xylocopa sonorina TaxID=1818115 RepID=UPI00403A7D5B
MRDDQGDVSINATTLRKLLLFWKENPTIWFTQVELTFDLGKINSDETKYKYVVTQLDQHILPYIADVLTSRYLTARGKYDEVKRHIINTFDKSSESKLRRALRSRGIGDEKPLHFLQRLKGPI